MREPAVPRPPEPPATDAGDVSDVGARPPEPVRVVLVRDGERAPGWVYRYLLITLGGVLLLGLVNYLFTSLRSLLIVLLISMFASFAIEPAVNRLAALGWRRGPATAVVFIAFLVATIAFIGLIGVVLVQQVANLLEEAPGYIDDLIAWVNRTFDVTLTSEQLIAQVEASALDFQSLATDLTGQAVSITTQVIGVAFKALTISLFTFYLVADGPRLRRAICSLLRPDRQHVVLDVWELAIGKTGGYLYSRLLLATLSAVCSWVAFELLGLPAPVAIAVWVGVVSQFVPVIGAYLAGIIPVLLALIQGPFPALWTVAFIAVYQQIENYVFSPRITARTMQLHPAVAFGAVLAGSSTLGAVGAILALPAAAVLQAVLSSSLTYHPVVTSGLTAVPATRVRRHSWWQRLTGGGEPAPAASAAMDRGLHDADETIDPEAPEDGVAADEARAPARPPTASR